jgi:hypothetical protein
VLKVYGKQLSQTRVIERKKTLDSQSAEDKINISAVGKRQAIIDKVASDIVDRITKSGPQDQVDREIIDKLEDELGAPIEFKKENNEFVFNVITKNNEKTTTALQVDDPDYLISRLEKLAKEAVDKNMEL